MDVPEIVEAHRLWLLLLFEELRIDAPEMVKLGDAELRQAGATNSCP